MLRRALSVFAMVLAGCQDSGVSQPALAGAIPRDVPAALRPYIMVDAEAILLTNVTVLAGDGGPALENHWVLVDGDSIEAIGPMEQVPSGNGRLTLDLPGHTVIPGLIGMHNHTHMPGNRLLGHTAPRLYLAGGVTTIATAGAADPIGELELALLIERGEIPGPTIFASAPYITGPGGNPPMDKPETREAVQRFVEEWAGRGVSWFKIYRHTDPAIAAMLIEEAHARGVKVTGHLCSISYADAARMGFDSLEHGLSAASDFVADRPAGECRPTRASLRYVRLDSDQVNGLIDVLVENDVTITSTLAILETAFAHRPQADDRSLEALSPSWAEASKARQVQLAESAETSSSTPEIWALFTGFERRFVAAGGRLVAGPDTGRHILPGYGDQRNFELLVEAGFSTPDVVRIMTFNGAETLGIEQSVGRIAPGQRADLVVLEGDLRADPSMIRNVRIVFNEGLGFDPASLIQEVKGRVGDQ